MDMAVATHFQLIEDDTVAGLQAGDIVACLPYEPDLDKLRVCFRVSDDYDPRCTIEKDRVELVLGQTPVMLRQIWRYERVLDV